MSHARYCPWGEPFELEVDRVTTIDTLLKRVYFDASFPWNDTNCVVPPEELRYEERRLEPHLPRVAVYRFLEFSRWRPGAARDYFGSRIVPLLLRDGYAFAGARELVALADRWKWLVPLLELHHSIFHVRFLAPNLRVYDLHGQRVINPSYLELNNSIYDPEMTMSNRDHIVSDFELILVRDPNLQPRSRNS